MDDQPTCGKGLAEHSVLPAKLSELITSMAENLEVHMEALDLDDDNSRQEHAAYGKLARQHHEIAARLRATAGQMAAYRDLPMGRHDEMSSSKVREAFEKLVHVERNVLAMLEYHVARHEEMLAAMAASRDPGSGISGPTG